MAAAVDAARIGSTCTSGVMAMSEAMAARISADEAVRKMADGVPLVCAYDDDAKCTRLALDGAITLSELRAREAGMPTGQELLFYCA